MLFLSSLSAIAATGQAIVKSVTGQGNAGEGRSLLPGQKLGPGTTIRTAPAALMELDLGINGQRLIVKGETTLSITTLEYSRTTNTLVDTQLEIIHGEIAAQVSDLPTASKYHVKTARGMAGIHNNTGFSLTSGGTVSVSSGTVTMIYIVDGLPMAPQTVKAGQSLLPPKNSGLVRPPRGFP